MKKTTVQDLIDKTSSLLKKRYAKDVEKHHVVVAASVLAKSGKVYTSLNIGTYQPSIATCAEISAIGMGHTAEKDFEIDTIVAMRDLPSYVISPCGKCREYIADYSDDAIVVVPDEKDEYALVHVSELLPNKYVKKV